MYDLDALKRELGQIEENIKRWKEGLEEQEQKKSEYIRFIAEAEAILKIHGVEDGGKK